MSIKEEELARSMDGKVFKVFNCFGREFTVCYQYSAEDGGAIPNYPDFEAEPQYSEDGRPFALVSQPGCPLAKSDVSGAPFEGECGACAYFFQGDGFSLFGLCENEARREKRK